MPKPNWEDRYATGDLPWDVGEPDQHLIAVVGERQITPGRALEIGYGTGSDSVWLAGAGFQVTGVDLSAAQLRYARRRVRGARTNQED